MRLKRLAVILTTFTVGVVFAAAILQAGTPPPALAWADTVFDPRVLSTEPPLPIPPLSAIIGGATTDADALAAVVDHYERNRAKLAAVFTESDDQRLRALYGMYIVHMAAPYNVVTRDWEGEGVLAFADGATAACGVYSQAQAQIYTALGLRWRQVEIDTSWHTLIEAQINGQFEIFDSTANVWTSEPVEALLDGTARQWRAFYTPILDANADDIYRAHIIESDGYYNVIGLRAGLPLWGLYVFPHRIEIIAESD
jgi:hypothetical protein